MRGSSYGDIRCESGGCKPCAVAASMGREAAEQSNVYLVAHADLNALKVGIAAGQSRLQEHQRDGWETVRVWDMRDGAVAYEVEQAVLAGWRAADYPPALEAGWPGYTETVSMAFVSIPGAIRQITIAMIDARDRLLAARLPPAEEPGSGRGHLAPLLDQTSPLGFEAPERRHRESPVQGDAEIAVEREPERVGRGRDREPRASMPRDDALVIEEPSRPGVGPAG